MLQVLLHSLDQASAQDRHFADQAIALLSTIVNTPDFMARVRQGKYSASYFQTDDNRSVQLTNDEIVQVIQSGKEYKTQPNTTIDIRARLARLGKNTVGGMTPPNPLITTNTRFFDDWRQQGDALSLAGHWFHEWLHVAGLRHVSQNPDYNDAVYQIGKMVIAVGRQQAPVRALSPGATPGPEPGQGYLDAYSHAEAHSLVQEAPLTDSNP